MTEVTLTIDGKEIPAKKDMTVLEAALENGIYIPHLCHHPDLEPIGACRLCMVDIEGKGMVISCKTSVKNGMVVRTESEEIDKIRRVAVELLIANHKVECLTCAKNTDCQLQHLANYMGIQKERLKQTRRPDRALPIDTSNPFFDYDPHKCVLCGICVRTCAEIQGVGAIDFVDRGIDTIVTPFAKKPWIESNCESCGGCVARCPVGALTPKNHLKPTHEVKSICPYCGCGCGIYLGVRGHTIVNVRGDVENPINQGNLCVKGRFGYRFVNHPDRLTTPLIKRNGKLTEATWEEALDLIAGKLANYEGDQFATIASARCTNEDTYVLQKFTRAVMGTNNIDCCARL